MKNHALSGKFPHVGTRPRSYSVGMEQRQLTRMLKRGRKARWNCLPSVSCALWEEGELFDFL